MQKMRKEVLDKMLVTPVTIYPPTETDSLGDATPAEPVNYKGYLYERSTKVRNSLGEEVLSGVQIYLQGKDAKEIDILSTVTCETHINSPIISKEIYRGREGSLVVGILYLP